MPIMFNSLLQNVGVSLDDVCLLRHQDHRMTKGLSPYNLWRTDRARFELYQSRQKMGVNIFRKPLWASFVGIPNNKTLFVGLYNSKFKGLLRQDTFYPNGEIEISEHCDVYDLELDKKLEEFQGKLFIEWGANKRVWKQYATTQNKLITELYDIIQEPVFPGYLNFIKPLSEIDNLPLSWMAVLENAKGIYLLTCPKTKEQYVGKADGACGFWQRWQDYTKTGHGGNVALKSREMSDYQVSILEVAGTAATFEEIQKMEDRWKAKLQSREMGLNRN